MQPGQRLHQCAGAQEAGHTQRDVPENDDERGDVDAAALLRQGTVDDEQVLQADGRHVGQTHGQPLKIDIHGCDFLLMLFTPVFLPAIMIP